MNAVFRWAKSSSPLVKMVMAISVTTAFVLSIKLIYKPHVRRSRLQQAEEWANSLIEQEEKMTTYDNS